VSGRHRAGAAAVARGFGSRQSGDGGLPLDSLQAASQAYFGHGGPSRVAILTPVRSWHTRASRSSGSICTGAALRVVG
jgi:hypothetical protein